MDWNTSNIWLECSMYSKNLENMERGILLIQPSHSSRGGWDNEGKHFLVLNRRNREKTEQDAVRYISSGSGTNACMTVECIQ